MQTAGSFHDQFVKAFAHITINLAHNAIDFYAANAVLNTNTLFRDLSVLFLLLGTFVRLSKMPLCDVHIYDNMEMCGL